MEHESAKQIYYFVTTGLNVRQYIIIYILKIILEIDLGQKHLILMVLYLSHNLDFAYIYRKAPSLWETNNGFLSSHWEKLVLMTHPRKWLLFLSFLVSSNLAVNGLCGKETSIALTIGFYFTLSYQGQ